MRVYKRVLGFASIGLFALVLAGCDNQQLVGIPETGAAPVALIAGDQSYDPLATAAFDGSTSHAASPKTIVSYAWAITERPTGSASQIVTGSAPSNVTFFVDLAGSYVVELTVTDSVGMTGSTQYAFNCVPSQGLHLELTWINQYTMADMDLHLVNISQSPADGVLFDTLGCMGAGSTIATGGAGCDCGFQSCAKGSNGMDFPSPDVLDWFQPDVADDNPTLDIDNINISVPENINIIKPAAGTYEVKVHYYGGQGIPVDATVNVYFAGAQAWTGLQHFDALNQLWDVGTVTVTASGASTFAAKTYSDTTTANLGTCVITEDEDATCDGS